MVFCAITQNFWKNMVEKCLSRYYSTPTDESATFSFVFMQLKVRLKRNGSQGKLTRRIGKYYVKTTKRPRENVPSCGKVILLSRLTSFVVLLFHFRRPTDVLRHFQYSIHHQITCMFG